MVIFKLIMALFGAQAAKWTGNHPAAGLLIGGLFGHFLDILAYKKFVIWKYRHFHSQRLKAQAEADFLFCFFTLAGKICLSDNKICKEEEKIIDDLIKDRFKLKRKDKSLAKKYFLGSGKQNIALQTLASKLVEVLGGEPKSLENSIYTLKEIAEVDGIINEAEFRALFTVASVLGLDPEMSQRILKGSTNRNSKSGGQSSSSENGNQKTATKSPQEIQYEILGCKPTDNPDKIKRSYRELVAKYHPDKIISKDLPQDFIDFAAQKFKEVQTAYESVRKLRGF